MTLLYDTNSYKLIGNFLKEDTEEFIKMNPQMTIDKLEIEQSLYEKLIMNVYDADEIYLNKDLISSNSPEVKDLNIFIYESVEEHATNKKIDIEDIKSSFIEDLRAKCTSYISKGLIINGKQYKYSYIDQINIANLLKRDEDYVYYHASGEALTKYSKDELNDIYIQLENNKNYNLTYFNVLKHWIKENYTEEMYSQHIFITYGYINDEVESELKKLYDLQLLK